MGDRPRRDVIRSLGTTAAVLAIGPAAASAVGAPPPQRSPAPVRRIVTAQDAADRSRFLSDGEPPQAFQAKTGDVVVTEIWMSDGSPADNSGAAETVDGPFRMVPAPGGSILRFVDFPPEAEYRAALARDLSGEDDGSGIVTAMREGRVGRSDGFHRTHTLDYAIVLSGEIYALMDEGERLMRAGEVLVQRGTSHAWENRSSTTARVAFILIDAKPNS